MENQINMSEKKLLPVVELFKKSFDVYWGKAWILFKIALFSFVAVLPIIILGLIGLIITSIDSNGSKPSVTIILVDILLGLIAILCALIISVWAQTALFIAAKEQQDIGFKNLLSIAWKKLGSLFWIGFITGLAIMGGFILFIIPGIIFSVWFSLAIYVFIYEDLRGTVAMKRSKQLVKGYWWPILGRIAIITIITMLISSIKFFGPFINAFFITPFSIVYMCSLYEDLKRVKS